MYMKIYRTFSYIFIYICIYMKIYKTFSYYIYVCTKRYKWKKGRENSCKILLIFCKQNQIRIPKKIV